MSRIFCMGIALGCSAVTVHAADSDADLDTVIVNASRIGTSLEESASNGALGAKTLLDTPFSITVIDADEIARRQVNSVAQLFVNDPSVVSNSPAATTAWWGTQIRGMGVRNYYIDGVPLMMSYGGEFPLEPIERAEALKGLTGFMHGFGTPGGVLSYTTKRPTDEPLATTTLEYRDDSALRGHVDLGGRVGDAGAFGYRINVAGEFGEAYTTAEQNRTLASVALDYRIDADLEWFATGLYQDSKLENEPLYFYWDVYRGDRLPRPTYDYANVTVGNSYYSAKTLMATTGFNWQMNDRWKSTLTVGFNQKQHRSNKMFGYLLNEAGDYQGEAYNFTGLLKNYFAQALAQGEIVTGPIRHELVVGTGYQRATDQWGNDWHWSNDFNGNIYERQLFVVTRTIDFSLAPVSGDERQSAVFASDTLHFGDHWQFLAGARYTDFELIDLDRAPATDSGYSTDELSPTLALIFKPAGVVTIYGSYIEAMEAGTRVGEPYANIGDVLDATVSKQYELGAKFQTARTSFTAAAFRVERAAQIDQFRDGLRYLTQDGMTQYDGLEAMGNVAVTDHFTMGLGATYLDAAIERVSEENADLKGKRPAGSSEWQAVAHADYRLPRIPGLSIFGSVRYLGDAYYEDMNLVLLPDHTLVNVGFQYQTELAGRRTVLAGSVNNLFNEKYWDLNTLGEGVNGALSVQVRW